MTHTYQGITTPDATYTSMSVMKITEEIEAKLTWFIINPDYDTWIELVNPIELLSRERWCDWYADNYSSETLPTYSYSLLTKSDNTFNPITTPAKTYVEITKPDNTFNPLTTPTKTYIEITTPTKTYNEITTPSKTYNKITTPTKTYSEVTSAIKTYSEVTK